MREVSDADGTLVALVRCGWHAPTRHLVTGILVALPVSFFVLLLLMALLSVGVGAATMAMAVVQLVVSLAVAGKQTNRGYRP